MKRIPYFLTVLLLMLATPSWADADLTVKNDSVEVNVTFFTPRSVHITKTPLGSTLTRKSLVVNATPQQVKLKKGESGSEKYVSSEELTVRVNKKTGRVSFEGKKIKNLLHEESYSFEPRTTGADKGTYRVNTTFAIQKEEPIYGLGTLQDGKLSHRGKHVEMEQSNLQDFQNVFQSIRGWAIYWDNYSRTIFVSPEGQNTMSLSSETGDGVDYYFMFGGSADKNIAEMRTLSGQVPMFPLWTYGYWQSKERYKSARELLSVLRRYRESQVPIDGIIQDWQYWGSNYTWNAMEFIHEDFKDGKRMIDEVHRQNAHFMISIWASFGPMTKQYKELDEKGLLYDFETWPQSGLPMWPPRRDYMSGVRVYDALSPEARNIYWRYLTQLLDAGTDAWWMDSTDPDYFFPKDADYEHKAGDGTWRRYRNAFPLASVSGVYDNQRKACAKEGSKEKRVFIMTRSAFAGQQRYGSGLWSGDVRSSWEVLRQQIPLGLNYSLTGCPNFNTDIGGFFCGDYNTRGSNSAPRNPQYQELYVRWMQYGLFCPVFRSHGTESPREIWEFGKPGEAIYDAILAQINLRYRLLPYLYSTAWQVTSNNASYLRPLFSDFAKDKRTWEMGDEFMFGNSILAAPVLEAQYTPEGPRRKSDDTKGLEGWSLKNTSTAKGGYPEVDFSGKKSTTKYLPKGALWYDFWTNQQYSGGQDVTIETTLDHVPMFVRAGSILPLGPVMQYAGEKAWDKLELRVYPGANGSFTLYEDEGDNYNYEKGVYATITMSWNNGSRTLTIGARKGQYPGMLSSRQFNIVLPDGTQKTVDYNGTEISIKL